MILIGNVLSGLIALAIIFLGSRFLWVAPASASADFGIRRLTTALDRISSPGCR